MVYIKLAAGAAPRGIAGLNAAPDAGAPVSNWRRRPPARAPYLVGVALVHRLCAQMGGMRGGERQRGSKAAAQGPHDLGLGGTGPAPPLGERRVGGTTQRRVRARRIGLQRQARPPGLAAAAAAPGRAPSLSSISGSPRRSPEVNRKWSSDMVAMCPARDEGRGACEPAAAPTLRHHAAWRFPGHPHCAGTHLDAPHRRSTGCKRANGAMGRPV